MADSINLVRVPFRVEALVRLAKQRRLPIRELDDGYLAHSILRELWQENAPAPFVLRERSNRMEAWGYSAATAAKLQDHARAFGDPSLLAALDGGLDAIASKVVPSFPAGKRVGFMVRVCPVVRLSNGRGGKKGREVDAFLARCWQVGKDVVVSRECVYREWLQTRFTPDRVGVRLERVIVDAYQRERFVRRTQPGSDGTRRGASIERPDVRLSGELVVENSDLFSEMLRRGVGRHKAFGFGMVLLVPPGQAWDAPGDARAEARTP